MLNDRVVTFAEQVEDDLGSVITANVRKVLDAAEANGWQENPMVSVVVRLAKPGDGLAKPFFMSWHLTRTAEGKRSWRFAGARAGNGQPLNYRDCLVYLEDPSVIYPEPPAETESENA